MCVCVWAGGGAVSFLEDRIFPPGLGYFEYQDSKVAKNANLEYFVPSIQEMDVCCVCVSDLHGCCPFLGYVPERSFCKHQC